MMDWTIPGLYVLVYLDKRAEGFDLVHHIDMERPFVICPQLKGSEWGYLRRKIMAINTLGLKQIINHELDRYTTPAGHLSTTVTRPYSKKHSYYTSLVELMSAHSFLPKEKEEVHEATIMAYDQIGCVGFDPNDFHAEIIRVDFGTAGLHEYCLFGGLNRFVYNILKKHKPNRELMGYIISSMNEGWHEKIASYLGVILWSKVKVSPLLRATLIDDLLAFESVKKKREVETAFQTMVMRALMGYARKPL
jgi:hypothetical protein